VSKKTKSLYLSQDRSFAIRRALEVWYSSVERKTTTLQKLGLDLRIIQAYISGLRTVSPKYMEVLFGVTGDRNFLMTAEEKAAYNRLNHGLADSLETWPDLSEKEAEALTKKALEIVSKDILEDLVERLEEDLRDLQVIESLPSQDPLRERARKNTKLTATMVKIFEISTMLSLEFPEEFNALRANFASVNQAFGKTTNSKR
jgi:hypothetical protein